MDSYEIKNDMNLFLVTMATIEKQTVLSVLGINEILLTFVFMET